MIDGRLVIVQDSPMLRQAKSKIAVDMVKGGSQLMMIGHTWDNAASVPLTEFEYPL